MRRKGDASGLAGVDGLLTDRATGWGGLRSKESLTLCSAHLDNHLL